jgi:hypothetical protein
MKRVDFEKQLLDSYPNLKNSSFFGRYFLYSKIESELKKLPDGFNLKTEGHSVLGKSIYSVEFGKGKTKILMWSQMHGNETTTTKAVFDLLNSVESQQFPFLGQILENCHIKIIPVLNPDGADAYTRENHNGIDLNRDAKNLSQPESKVLDKVFEEFQPDFCFNLHDQRTIYSAGNNNEPATLSFLAPSADEGKSLTEARKTAMKLIASLNKSLQRQIPAKIGRYDDGFNPNCVGDKFQSRKVPTLLFEAGHFPEDYQREETRKLVFFSLVKVLVDISDNSYLDFDCKKYFDIPENKKLFYDIIIRNVSQNGQAFDLAVQYLEKLSDNILEFIPLIEELGDLSGFFGHREIGKYGKENLLTHPSNPKTGMKADYLELNRNVILLKLSKQ